MRINSRERWRQYECYIQIGQANQRLAAALFPPFARGIMCSISKRAKTKCCGLRQYPHRFWAAARTRRSTAAEMEARAMRSRECGSQATGHRDLPGLGFAH